MSERYYGGVQTPLTLALLRAAAIRRRFGIYTEFQLNDTDTAGTTPAEQPAVEVTAESKRRWQPVYWVHPLTSLAASKRCLHIHSPEPLTIASLKLDWPELRSVIEAETLAEIAWAEQLATEDRLGRTGDPAEAHRRADELRTEALRLLGTAPTLGQLWLDLGRWALGNLLDGVTVVTFAGGYWTLTPETASDERFAVLDRCLADPANVLGAFYAARSITSYTLDRLPYFAVHQPNGAIIREELNLSASGVRLGAQELPWARTPRSGADLARLFAEHGLQVSVVPKALALMVQIRKMGSIYVTDPPYLSQAVRFAELLGEPQHGIVRVQFDLSKALGRSAWRALLQGYRHRRTGRATSAEETHWRTHPTLLMLYVLGGRELVARCVDTATFNGRP